MLTHVETRAVEALTFLLNSVAHYLGAWLRSGIETGAGMASVRKSSRFFCYTQPLHGLSKELACPLNQRLPFSLS